MDQPAWHNPAHVQPTRLDTVEPSFLSATILLILITDPLGNIPLFIASMRQVEPERRRHIIVRECAIALVVLLIFLFFGQSFLRVLHLTDESIKIAGGVVLFLIALRMTFPPASQDSLEHAAPDEPLIVPLAIPMIAGPSALATVLLASRHAEDHAGLWVAAVILACAVNACLLLASGWFARLFGKAGMEALERLMGLILTTIAVQMLIKGIRIAFNIG